MSPSIDLDRWVDTWRGPLVGLLLARGAGAHAEDLALEVFAQAWMSRERFRGDPDDDAHVGPWLAGIARNLHRSEGRGRQDVELPADVAAPESEDGERAQSVRRAVERLPESEREVVQAFYLEETTTARVAALLGIGERVVEGRLRRARARLRNWLEAPLPS